VWKGDQKWTNPKKVDLRFFHKPKVRQNYVEDAAFENRKKQFSRYVQDFFESKKPGGHEYSEEEKK
jgi:hypothetical protein